MGALNKSGIDIGSEDKDGSKTKTKSGRPCKLMQGLVVGKIELEDVAEWWWSWTKGNDWGRDGERVIGHPPSPARFGRRLILALEPSPPIRSVSFLIAIYHERSPLSSSPLQNRTKSAGFGMERMNWPGWFPRME